MAETANERICLVAIDGSKHSEIALKWFKDNVYRTGDKVLLAHCVDHKKHFTHGTTAMVPGNPDTITHKFKEEEKKAEEVMNKCMEDAKTVGLDNVEMVKVIGSPGEGIIETLHKRKANLIVTGCRGLGQIRRTVLGSVSDYILHHSDVPVFICRH